MAEANEPPHLAVRRELNEELGLDVQVGALLVVDWVSPHGPWDDLLAFVFDGGELSDEQIAGLKLRDDADPRSQSPERGGGHGAERNCGRLRLHRLR